MNHLLHKADILRRIPLESVLRLTGARQDTYDKAKWHTEKGVLSVSGAKFMNWNRGRGGGGAIDLIIHLKDLDFKEALLWLSNNLSFFDTQGEPAAKRTLLVPQRSETRKQSVIHYLTGRHIPSCTLTPLIDSGRLYADNRGNAVFLLLGKEKNIVGAELRGTSPIPFKAMAPGSRKDKGFFYVGDTKAKKVVLCESAIDALSFFTLYQGYLAISTSGATSNPLWLKVLITRGYDIFCGFDSDYTGDSMATTMSTLYPTVKRLRPSHHDWNDVLASKTL
jgi:Protein of unknown function (DUF3991)/Toprim-like